MHAGSDTVGIERGMKFFGRASIRHVVAILANNARQSIFLTTIFHSLTQE